MKKLSLPALLVTAFLLCLPSQGNAVSITKDSVDCPLCGTTVAPGTDIAITFNYTVGSYSPDEHLESAMTFFLFTDFWVTRFIDGLQESIDATPGSHSVSWHVLAPPVGFLVTDPDSYFLQLGLNIVTRFQLFRRETNELGLVIFIPDGLSDPVRSGVGYTNFFDVSDAAPVPGPEVGAGLPGLLACAAGFIGWRRRRRAAA